MKSSKRSTSRMRGQLREELGDLLLQVLFHAQIATEAGTFTIDDVMQRLAEKLVHRHPHVFDKDKQEGGSLEPEEVVARWEEIKRKERKDNDQPASPLDGVPKTLPALLRAFQLQARASRVGFDWPHSREGVAQVQEVTSSPKWVRGLFDGRIHLSIEELAGDLTARQAALRHEYTHAVVHRLSGGHAPTWLTEGLALYFEGGDMVRHREDPRRQARTRLPLTSLHGSFLTLEARSARLAYAESYGATRALVQRHGLTGVRRLLETLAVVPDLATAFETVLPERYSDFQAAWARMAAGTRF